MTTPTPTETTEVIVLEFELPRLPRHGDGFSEMQITGYKFDVDGKSEGFQTGIFDIGPSDGVLYDNVASMVATRLASITNIATAEVTITGYKWRIEVTEGHTDFPNEELNFHISVFGHWRAVGVELQRSVQQQEADPPANDGDGDGGDQEQQEADPPANDGDGDGNDQEQQEADPPANDGDETPPEDQPDPEPEGGGNDDLDGLIPPEGDGGALTNVDAGDEEEEAQPETWLEQQLRLANTPVESGGANDGGRARRQVELNEGELVNVDAGELDGLTLPEDAGGAHSGRYGLYWNPGDGGRFQLRFDDETTGALTPAATAAAIYVALKALDGITEAEVTGEPGDWTLTITADAGHPLQAIDSAFDGDLQLDYMGA